MRKQHLKTSGTLSLAAVLSVLFFLSASLSVADNISRDPGIKENNAQSTAELNLAQSDEEDLDDFFDEDPQDNGSDSESEDLDDFFEDTEERSETEDPFALSDDTRDDSGGIHFFINGDISIKTGYRFGWDPAVQGVTDHSGLSHVTGELNLETGAKFFKEWDFFVSGSAFHNLAYEFQGDENYTDKFLDENESEVELKKCYIRGNLTEKLDLKLGRQIVVWGKSDNIRITDVLNPLDLREPGMTDIEDLRMPVFMTRLDYYFSNISLSAYLLHEHRSHKLPVYGSSYYYLPFALPEDKEPSLNIKNTEFALAVAGIFSGFDVSLYFADIYDDVPYLNAENRRLHKEIYMTGIAANKADGNFLYKAEAAFFDGIRLSAYNQNGLMQDNLHEYSRLDYLAGIEYSGFKNTSLSFEAADRWFVDFDNNAERSGEEEHTVQYAIRGSRTFFNEVLEISVLASLYGTKADEGGFVRINAAYDYTDDLVFELGVIFYDSGSASSMLKEIGENDVVFLSVTYNF